MKNVKIVYMPRYIKKAGKSIKKKNTTCKRRRVRISADGSYNESDMKHNKHCERKHMAKTLKNKNFKGGFEPEEVRRSLNDGGWATGKGSGLGAGPGAGPGVAAGGKKKSKGKKTRRPRRK